MLGHIGRFGIVQQKIQRCYHPLGEIWRVTFSCGDVLTSPALSLSLYILLTQTHTHANTHRHAAYSLFLSGTPHTPPPTPPPARGSARRLRAEREFPWVGWRVTSLGSGAHTRAVEDGGGGAARTLVHARDAGDVPRRHVPVEGRGVGEHCAHASHAPRTP